MSAVPTASPVRARPALLAATRLFNPLAMLLAGTRLLPMYGVIEHRGRRSGRVFRTPVVVRPTSDGFVVPLPHGPGTDWCRNVRAAGGCTVRWRGREHSLVEPEVLAGGAARRKFGRIQRFVMGRLGIDMALWLRRR